MKKLSVLLFLSFMSFCALAQTVNAWDVKIDPLTSALNTEHKLMLISAGRLPETPMFCYVKKVDIEGEPLKYFVCFQSEENSINKSEEMPIELSEAKEIITIIKRLKKDIAPRGIISNNMEFRYSTEFCTLSLDMGLKEYAITLTCRVNGFDVRKLNIENSNEFLESIEAAVKFCEEDAAECSGLNWTEK